MQCDTHTQTLVLTGPADYHTPILDWCAVRLHRSGFCALLHVETAPFYPPPSPRSCSPRVPDREPLFSPRWAAIISSLWPYYAEPLRPGHTARGPCHVAVPPPPKCSETVMMVMMIVMMTATPLFMVSTHRLSGLHCSATFIKKSVS